jgi:hypothetical protein
MANKLKTDLWKKAYLIEFVSADPVNRVMDAFTFSVPPESEEITYSQRKSETKTFGGLHVDDYGMDAVKITLSGSTINQNLKKIYNPEGADKWMTGEQEIYYLRDLLVKHKTGVNLTLGSNIMLYDLSKMSYITGGTKSGSEDETGRGNIKNYWRVFPGDFKIRRSSDKPFTYKYSIEFTAVDFEDSVNKDNILAPKLDSARAALDFLKKGISVLEKGMKYIENANMLLENLNSAIRDVTDILDAYADILAGYIEGVTNMFDTAHEIIKIPGDVSTKALNIGLEFMNAGKKLLRSVEAITGTIRSYGTSEYWAPQEVLDEYKMTAAEYADTWADLCAGLEDNANTIVSVSKSGVLPNVTVGPGDPITGTQVYVLSYGDTEAKINSTDTLESLAARFYGSPDRALDIAIYNGVASIDELNPGDTIKIPVLSISGLNLYNRIFCRPEDRDNYGRDIYLDKDGYTAPSTSGDYMLTDGVNNLNQAILLRLRESVNRRIRLIAYGIRTNISDPTAGAAYIISSIDLTVNGEPRVGAVNNISFTGAGDGLNITVDYTDINHADGSAAGRV